jgi:phage/plasmid primase-like uncharacterized protein
MPKWVRTNRRNRCQICGKDWCTYLDGSDLVRCMRVASDRPCKDGGWFHKLNGKAAAAPAPRPSAPARLSPAEAANLARNYATAINPERLELFALDMGLSIPGLRRLGIGWAHDKSAWAFPMRDATGRITGLRLRTDAGRKFSIAGSREGLFIPDDLSGEGMLLICEGPTSCAALLDLGFDAIGRPSCNSGNAIVRNYLNDRPRRDVVILGDHDATHARPDGGRFRPGQDGARRLAQDALGCVRSLKVVIPPRCKDARDWLAMGATAATLRAIIRAANYLTKERV